MVGWKSFCSSPQEPNKMNQPLGTTLKTLQRHVPKKILEVLGSGFKKTSSNPASIAPPASALRAKRECSTS